MRGTFYSNTGGVENPGERRILEDLSLSNILELSEQEKSILDGIKRIMNEECDRLQFDIDEVQAQLLSESKQKAKRPPTSKELKDFSQKLQDELLRSDQIVKVVTAPSGLRKKSQPRIGGSGAVSSIIGGSNIPILKKNVVNMLGNSNGNVESGTPSM